MSIVPSIKDSAQARLKLYQVISAKLNKAQQRLLEADPTLWEKVLAELEASVQSAAEVTFDQTILDQAFSAIEKTSKEGLQRQVKFLTGKEIWIGRHPTNLLQAFIEEHQKLIKSIQTEQLDKISLTIKRGIREGRMTKDIAKEIQQTTGLSKKRAQLIARNSALNYSGAVTKQNQIEAGFTKYTWQTSQDERVRKSHISKNGKVYEWASPGPHPRSEVNCRCDAIPKID
jgi:SPP1 gp7 family putative phage head morphogenesis protein